MIIMESAMAMNNDYIECSNTLGKIELFAEASYKEYEINLKEVALKVLKENGTTDDFDFLATEAANGYIERAKKTIEKIVEAVKKFIRACKERLVNLVTNAKTNAAVDKVEEVCKSNPKFRSQKVEYQNTDKQVGILQRGIDGIRKKVSKVKAKGVATPEDIEAIENIEADTMKKVVAVSVVTAVTVGTAVSIYKQCNSNSEVDKVLNEDSVSDCDITVNEENAKTAETAAFFTKASGLIAKLKKEKASKTVVKSTSLLAAIKKAVSKAKGGSISENLEEIKESALENLTIFSYISEASKDEDEKEEKSESVENEPDLDEYFEELCEDLFTDDVTEDEKETDEVTEESAMDNVDDAVVYMEQLEAELFGNDEEVATESTESTDNDSDMTSVYMEQLEAELFGNDEEVATESASVEDESSEENQSTQSLLEEMENLLK